MCIRFFPATTLAQVSSFRPFSLLTARNMAVKGLKDTIYRGYTEQPPGLLKMNYGNKVRNEYMKKKCSNIYVYIVYIYYNLKASRCNISNSVSAYSQFCHPVVDFENL